MSAFVPGASDDALCPRLVLVGVPSWRQVFAREVGARPDEIFAPLAAAGVCGMRGPGVAVVGVGSAASPWERRDLLVSLLRVQGFDVLTAGGPGVVERSRAHLERFRRERGGQLELEVPR